MDLDELKESWQEQDKKLNESLKINQFLLMNMKLDKSKSYISTILKYEQINLISCFLMIILLIYSSLKFPNKLVIISSIISLLIFCLAIYSIIIKLKQLYNLKQNNTSILEFQKGLNIFEKFYLKCRKIELILIPFILFISAPPLKTLIHGKEKFLEAFDSNHIVKTIGTYAIGALVTIILVKILYKYLYNNKIKNINKIFNDLNEFQSNE